jgi:hypothetical protein
MKLYRLLVPILLAPASAFAQCASGPVYIQCQLSPPVITSPLTITCDLHGDPCNYQITATTAPGTTITGYNMVHFPTGTFYDLVINTSTGAISGTVNPAFIAPGTYGIELSAYNLGGPGNLYGAGTAYLMVTVIP